MADDNEAPLAPRASIYPVIAQHADDALLEEVDAFLAVVRKSQTDGRCVRFLSALLADAKWHRFGT